MSKELNEVLQKNGKEFVEAAYKLCFDREADEAGLRAYEHALNSGTSKEKIIFELRMSDEGINQNAFIDDFSIHEITTKELLSFKGDKFITACYLAILGRLPDEEGLLHHTKSLATGAFTKLGVIKIFAESEEGVNRNTHIKDYDKEVSRAEFKEKFFKNKDYKEFEIKVSTEKQIQITFKELNNLRQETRKIMHNESLEAMSEILKDEVFEDTDITINKLENEETHFEYLANLIDLKSKKSLLDLCANDDKWLSFSNNNDLTKVLVKEDPLSFICDAVASSYDVITILDTIVKYKDEYIYKLLSNSKRVLNDDGIMVIRLLGDKKVNVVKEMIEEIYTDTRVISLDNMANIKDDGDITILIAYKEKEVKR